MAVIILGCYYFGFYQSWLLSFSVVVILAVLALANLYFGFTARAIVILDILVLAIVI